MARSFWLLALLVLLAVFLGPHGTAQDQQKSATDLIRRLTYQDDQSDNPFKLGLFTCGSHRRQVQESLPVYESLVKMGRSALPAIEEVLGTIEEANQGSFFSNSHYLLFAYARISGTTAWPRLQRMLDNPKLDYLRWGLDGAVALSLGLTSYVSSTRVLLPTFSCTGLLEPRHFMDQLILAWERNDREYAEASLGPNAKKTLRSPLEGRTWDNLRAEMWRSWSGGRVAVGYRFETSGWSSQPGEEDTRGYERKSTNPEIDMLFTGPSGEQCGRQKVTFLRTGGIPREYRVDNTDLLALLRTISACAAAPPSPPH